MPTVTPLNKEMYDITFAYITAVVKYYEVKTAITHWWEILIEPLLYVRYSFHCQLQ